MRRESSGISLVQCGLKYKMKKITKGLSVLLLVTFLGVSSPSLAQTDQTPTTQNANDDDDDNSGKLGLVGLLGLLGLLGLRKNKNDERKYSTTNTPR